MSNPIKLTIQQGDSVLSYEFSSPYEALDWFLRYYGLEAVITLGGKQ